MAQIINAKTGDIVKDYPDTSAGDAVLSYFYDNGIQWAVYPNAVGFLASLWENDSYFHNTTISGIIDLFPNLIRAVADDEIIELFIHNHIFVGTQNHDDILLWNSILSHIFPDLAVTG